MLIKQKEKDVKRCKKLISQNISDAEQFLRKGSLWCGFKLISPQCMANIGKYLREKE